MKGEDNIVANALSQLPIQTTPMEDLYFVDKLHSELCCYGTETMSQTNYPLSYKTLGQDSLRTNN